MALAVGHPYAIDPSNPASRSTGARSYRGKQANPCPYPPEAGRCPLVPREARSSNEDGHHGDKAPFPTRNPENRGWTPSARSVPEFGESKSFERPINPFTGRGGVWGLRAESGLTASLTQLPKVRARNAQ